jgi:hypothetical protein
MLLRGINYDIGTPFRKGELSRPDFDELVVKKEIAILEFGCCAYKGADEKRANGVGDY